jgi:hypothetical protein
LLFFFVRRPLITVETEVGFFGSPCQKKRFLSCLDYSGQPSTSTKHIFFLAVHYFTLCVAVVQGRLSLNVCLVAIEKEI